MSHIFVFFSVIHFRLDFTRNIFLHKILINFRNHPLNILNCFVRIVFFLVCLCVESKFAKRVLAHPGYHIVMHIESKVSNQLSKFFRQHLTMKYFSDLISFRAVIVIEYNGPTNTKYYSIVLWIFHAGREGEGEREGDHEVN